MALLVFSAAIVSESARFAAVADVQRTAQVFNEPQVLTTDFHEDWFFPNGEFVRVFSGAKIDFSSETRQLLDGKIFLGGTFFSDVADTTQTNKIQVANVIIDFTKTNVFLDRDASAQQVTVFAVSHPVILQFPDAENFVLPSGMKISFHDAFSATEKEYFERTQSLRMEPAKTWEIAIDPAPEAKIYDALVRHYDLRKQFRANAWERPELWRFVGLAQNLRAFSIHHAIGVSDKKKDQLAFDEAVIPILAARDLVESENFSAAEKKLDSFRVSQQSEKWRQLLLENSTVARDWRFFEQAQKIWLPITVPDRDESVFSRLWENPVAADDLTELEKLFWNTELFASNLFLRETKENLEKISQRWDSIHFTAEQLPRVTQLRRQLTALLQTDDFLRELPFFQLREKIIDSELALAAFDPKLQKTLALESGVETLHFFSLYVHEKNISDKKNITTFFIREISRRNISEIATEFKFQFSSLASDALKFIELGGAPGITLAELQKSTETSAVQDDLEAQLADLEAAAELPETEIVPEKTDLQNAKELWAFLTDAGIEISPLDFRSTRTDDGLESRFEKGYFFEQETSGTFDYLGQRFLKLQIGDEIEENIPRDFLKTWLSGMSDETVAEPEFSPAPETSVSQLTPESILARRVVEKMLQQKNIAISRRNITVLDEDFQTFQITEAQFQNLRLQFRFDQSKNTYSDLALIVGTTQEFFPETYDENAFFAFLNELVSPQK